MSPPKLESLSVKSMFSKSSIFDEAATLSGRTSSLNTSFLIKAIKKSETEKLSESLKCASKPGEEGKYKPRCFQFLVCIEYRYRITIEILVIIMRSMLH